MHALAEPMKHHIYLLLASAGFLASCGKEKETQPVLEGRFEAEAVIKATAITMYTHTGRVDNPALVDKFLLRRNHMSDYFSRVDVPIPAPFSLTLAFRGNNRVTLLSKRVASTDSILTEVTSQSPQRLVLTNKDSAAIGPYTPSDRTELLSSQMQSERATPRCWNVSSSSGTYGQYCRGRPVRVITRHDGKLFLPQLGWLIQTSSAYGTSYWA